MIIDTHVHFLPQAIVDLLRARDHGPRIFAGDGGERMAILRADMPYDGRFDNIALRLELMNRVGVDHQVQSLPGLFGIDALPADQSDPLTTAFNEGMAEIAVNHSDRFSYLAALPLDDMDLSVTRYRQARENMGALGMILPCHGFASLERAETYAPLFKAAAEIGGLIYVHPGPMPDDIRDGEGPVHKDLPLHRRVTIDIQNEITNAATTLAFSGFLEDYPGVPVQVSNLGGALPFYIERMDHVSALRTPDQPLPTQSIAPFYVDCASMGPKAIGLAAAFFGADRILFGTDNPMFNDERCIAAVKSSPLGNPEKSALLSGNAETLLDRVRRP